MLFPTLPDDIERFIFEILARHEPKSGFELLLVAKHVRQWVEPVLYRTIILADSRRLRAFWKVIQDNPKLAVHVRQLSVFYRLDREVPEFLALEELLGLVSACRFLTSLAVGPRVLCTYNGTLARAESFHSEIIPAFHSILNANLLGISVPLRLLESDTNLPNFSQPLYQSLTYLELQHAYGLGSWHVLRALVRLKFLVIHKPAIPDNHICSFLSFEIAANLPESIHTAIVFCDMVPNNTAYADWIIRQCDPRIVIATWNDGGLMKDYIVRIPNAWKGIEFCDPEGPLWSQARSFQEMRARIRHSDINAHGFSCSQ